jgi:phosphoribosylanthranilate isomerase
MSKIKICGLRSEEDIALINEAKPDYAGFIIDFPPSFRSLSLERFEELSKKVLPEIKRVGVFVNEEINTICLLAKKNLLDAIQLHGDESEEYIRILKSQTELPVIKAFILKSEEDVKGIQECSADYVLLDAGKGSGQSFAWNWCKQIHRDYFLAGGIGIENIEEALQINPYAIDLSSKLETNKKKDPAKVKALMSFFRKES